MSHIYTYTYIPRINKTHAHTLTSDIRNCIRSLANSCLAMTL